MSHLWAIGVFAGGQLFGAALLFAGLLWRGGVSRSIEQTIDRKLGGEDE